MVRLSPLRRLTTRVRGGRTWLWTNSLSASALMGPKAGLSGWWTIQIISNTGTSGAGSQGPPFRETTSSGIIRPSWAQRTNSSVSTGP